MRASHGLHSATGFTHAAMALFALKACQCHAEDPVLQLLPGHGGLASRGPPRTEQASRLTLGSSDEAPRQVLSGDARNIGDDSKAPKQSRSGDRHSEKNLEAPRQSLSGANRNSNEDSEADSRHKSSLSDSTASSSSGASGEQQRRLVRSAKIVISGMVEGFLRRKRSSEDYLRCAVPKVGNLAGAVLTSCAHTVNLIAKFLHVAQPIAPANRTTSAQTPYRVDDVDGATFLPGISQGLIEIIQLQGKLAAKCRNSQVIDSFELAATHLRNLSYVSGHLIANGADIVAELEDAAQAFELKDMRRFGVDIGGAWRKVLLSKVHLPDGASTKEAIKETSTGLIEGFFGSDLMLEIKTDRPRHSSGSSRHKQLHVDMEKCLQNENMRFFVEVWDATWIFFAQIAAYPSPSNATNQRWQDLLSVAFAEMPGALRRCGISKAQEAMLQDSLTALKGLHFRINMMRAKLHNREVSVDLKRAVKDWSKRRWHDFGEDIGKLLQQLVLLVFPQRYSVDNLGLHSHPPLSFGVPQLRGQPGQHFRPSSPVPAVALASSALLALSAAVALRSFPRCSATWQGSSGDPGVEDATDSDGALLAL